MMLCKGICVRFEIKISNQKAKYSDGYIRCKNCGGMVTHVDTVKKFRKDNPDLCVLGSHRCPCCHGVFKTHRKTKNPSTAYKNRNLTITEIETQLITSNGKKSHG